MATITQVLNECIMDPECMDPIMDERCPELSELEMDAEIQMLVDTDYPYFDLCR